MVLPNAVRPPAAIAEAPSDGPFRFLFLGNLRYYPNADAVRFFCSAVLPHMRRNAKAPFEVYVAGMGGSVLLRRLAAKAGVTMVGPVASVAPLYEKANAVIAPIRAGGGTRIKILEAFSYRRAVVSTSIGAEGIDAQDGAEVLLGDAPEELAACCLRLMNDRGLTDSLAGAGWRRWRESYSLESVRAPLDS